MAEIDDLNTTDASNTARFPEGMLPSAVNDAARALEGMLARFVQYTSGENFVAVTETGVNSLSVSIARASFSATASQSLYIDGLTILVDVPSTITDVPKLSINGHNKYAILGSTGGTLSSSMILAGQKCLFSFDLSAKLWRMLTPSAKAALNALAADGDGSSLTSIKIQGKDTIWVPAESMTPTATSGCAALARVETTAGRPDLHVLDFDTSADEHAQFGVVLPKSWNAGTVTFRGVWTQSVGAVTTGVAIGLQALGVADNESADTAFGTAVVVSDAAQGAVEEVYITDESAAVTIGGTLTYPSIQYFDVYRDVSHTTPTPADDLAGDMRLIGILLHFTTDAGDDT